jgi:glycine cleavage system H protein
MPVGEIGPMVMSNEHGRIFPEDALPCVWMSAGLVAYRLCDREFDCDGCPLDLALRGVSPTSQSDHRTSVRGRHATEFPEDRLYSTGHLWVQECPGIGKNFRVGLDGFASDLVGSCLAVRCGRIPRRLSRDRLVFELEIPEGTVPMGAPFDCEVVRWNRVLSENPQQVNTDPYGEGWIAQIVPTDSGASDGFLSAEDARKQARMDLRGFRRRAALYLLTDTAEVGACLPDGGVVLTDMRQMLGGDRYLQLLRELTH